MKTRCYKCHRPARTRRGVCKSCEQQLGAQKREEQRQEARARLRMLGWLPRL
jgi:hypothetical protein